MIKTFVPANSFSSHFLTASNKSLKRERVVQVDLFSSSYEPVLQLWEVCVKIEVPLLPLAKQLLQQEHICMGRVDQLSLNLIRDSLGESGFYAKCVFP